MAASRGAKVGIVLLVLLIILGGVLIFADRFAAGAAEDRIAEETQKQLVANNVTFEGSPDVDVTGFPFLTQVIGGEYEKISISLTRPKLRDVQLDKLDVDATKVKADARSLMNGTGDVVAGEIAGTATINWENVRNLLELANLPAQVDPAQIDLKVVENQIELRAPLTYQGFKVTIVARGAMVVAEGRVQLKLESVTTEQGDLPPIVNRFIEQNRDRLQVSLRLPGLPYDLVVNKVESRADGLLVIASAKDVNLTA